MSRIIGILALLFLVGCNSKPEIKSDAIVAIPEAAKPVEEAAKPVETKKEPAKTRNLHVKEEYVVSVLNANIGNRQKFDFVYSDKMETGRYYLDPESQIRIVFNGYNDDIEWAMTTMFLEKLLKEDEPENVKSFLNAASRMVLGVSPSVVEEADGWLDTHLVQSFLAKEPTTTIIRGFKLDVILVGDSPIVVYKISSAD